MRELFPGQDIDEKIYIAVREHPMILVMRLGLWLFLLVFYIIFKVYGLGLIGDVFSGTGVVILSLVEQVYAMFLLLALLIIFVVYYLNLYIVTNIRIVDIDQMGLFKHQISILNIAQIEDVTSDTNGILGTIFDYGTVYIQTAGAKERFEFSNVPQPAKLSKIIIDLFEEQTGKKTKS